MAFKLRDLVQETTTTTGTGDRVLDGAVADWHDFDDAGYVAADTVSAVIERRAGGTVEFEYGTYTYRTGPRRLEITDIRRSTNGGAAVNWTSGTKTVLVGAAAEMFQSLCDPGISNGILVKTAVGPAVVGRSVATDDGTRLPVSNGSGVSGNPTVSGAWLASNVLDRSSGATEAQRTMAAELVLNAVSSKITGYSSAKHSIKGQAAETLLEIERIGANDYVLRVSESGTYRRSVNTPDPAGADADLGKFVVVEASKRYGLQDWAPRRAYDSDATDTTGLSVTVVVPSAGTWDISVIANLTFNSSAGAGNVTLSLDENIDAGGAAAVAWGGNSTNNFPLPMDVVIPYNLIGATGGSSYVYTITIVSFSGITETPTPRIHTLFAECTRRA